MSPSNKPVAIPAIDLQQGRCVRLRQGRFEDATVFGQDPVAMADHWVAAGARHLHLVDLDGAAAGRAVQAPIIAKILARHSADVAIQIGGGIRSEEAVAHYLENGAHAVVIGTRAVESSDFVGDLCQRWPHRIIVGLDARDGFLAVEGWARQSPQRLLDVADVLARHAPAAFLYTDIGRDGMLSGLNLVGLQSLLEATPVPLIASGGVANMADIEALLNLRPQRLYGVIIGRALYEGCIDLAAVQAKLAD